MSTENVVFAENAIRNSLAEATNEEATSITHATVANALATLALVEEQRTANLVAYAQLLEAQYSEAAKHADEFDWDTRADSNVRHGIVLERIREGLGL